jgi:hypothetical protein
MKAPSRFALRAALVLAVAGAVWFFWPAAVPPPPLLDGLTDDGLRGAPCPARNLYEQNARRKQGVRPPAQLGERLRKIFPLGSAAAPLSAELAQENFAFFAPCPNDESVLGARWLSPDWTHADAFVYWRVDEKDRLIFLDGHVSRTN